MCVAEFATHILLLALEHFVDFFGACFGDPVNHQPNKGIACNENAGENKDGGALIQKPAVAQIGENVGNIQCATVEQDHNRQGQLLHMINSGHSCGGKSQKCDSQNACAHFIGREGICCSRCAENAIDDRQHHRTAAGT